VEQYERPQTQHSRLVGGTNTSKEPAAFVFTVEVMWDVDVARLYTHR